MGGALSFKKSLVYSSGFLIFMALYLLFDVAFACLRSEKGFWGFKRTPQKGLSHFFLVLFFGFWVFGFKFQPLRRQNVINLFGLGFVPNMFQTTRGYCLKIIIKSCFASLFQIKTCFFSWRVLLFCCQVVCEMSGLLEPPWSCGGVVVFCFATERPLLRVHCVYNCLI